MSNTDTHELDKHVQAGASMIDHSLQTEKYQIDPNANLPLLRSSELQFPACTLEQNLKVPLNLHYGNPLVKIHYHKPNHLIKDQNCNFNFSFADGSCTNQDMALTTQSYCL